MPSDLNNTWLLCLSAFLKFICKGHGVLQAIFKWITVNQSSVEVNLQPVKMLARLEILIWKPQAKLDRNAQWTQSGMFWVFKPPLAVCLFWSAWEWVRGRELAQEVQELEAQALALYVWDPGKKGCSFIYSDALVMTASTSDTMPCYLCLPAGCTAALCTRRPSWEMFYCISSIWCQKLQYLFWLSTKWGSHSADQTVYARILPV